MNVGQPDRVLADQVAGHKPERRPRAREEWLAVTKHDGAEVESILINKTKLGQASRQVWSANSNLACERILQPAYHHLYVIIDKHGDWADCPQPTRNDP